MYSIGIDVGIKKLAVVVTEGNDQVVYAKVFKLGNNKLRIADIILLYNILLYYT